MLRQPVAVITPSLGVPRQVETCCGMRPRRCRPRRWRARSRMENGVISFTSETSPTRVQVPGCKVHRSQASIRDLTASSRVTSHRLTGDAATEDRPRLSSSTRRIAAVLSCSRSRLPSLRLRSARTAEPGNAARHVVAHQPRRFSGGALDDLSSAADAATARVARRGCRRMRPVNPDRNLAEPHLAHHRRHARQHGVLFNGSLIREPGVPPRVEPWLTAR